MALFDEIRERDKLLLNDYLITGFGHLDNNDHSFPPELEKLIESYKLKEADRELLKGLV